jgi:L-alanine-DL-glutamate epimerase-like enolase superfamily enzyme
MLTTITRRNWIRTAMALSAGAWMSRYEALAQPFSKRVKITAIKAMQVNNIAGNCLIKIETDEGLVGYGEAGATGPMARARIDAMTAKGILIGEDPLSIGRHFHEMISLMHVYRPHIPTVSGIDIALWDLAGKITGLPVNVLLGGPFRDAIRMYSHTGGLNPLDPGACRGWVDRVRSMPEGFTAFKMGVHSIVGISSGRWALTLDSAQIRKVALAFHNLRNAAGEDIDIALHCHGELDTPSAIQVAKAIEPYQPLFYEDPLNIQFSDGWSALKSSTRLPILTGEKLELVGEFKQFLDAKTVDIIHPDLAFTGGFTGAKKIADYAQLSRIPVALHNVGSLVLCYASAHFGSAIHNFYRSESALGRPARHAEQMSESRPPEVKDGFLGVPDAPGIGFEPDEDYLRSQLVPGEPFWS